MAEIKGGETDRRISAILRKYGHAIEKREKDFFLSFFLGTFSYRRKEPSTRLSGVQTKPPYIGVSAPPFHFVFFLSFFVLFPIHLSLSREK